MLNSDYKDMLQSFIDHKVHFLVVGAYAMGVHGYPRATGDIDIWVKSSPDNAKGVYQALADFGAPLHDIEENTFCQEGIVFQIGVAPRRIDILTAIDGVQFDQAYANCTTTVIDGLQIPVLSKEDLIKNKQSTGRPKDQADIDSLRRL